MKKTTSLTICMLSILLTMAPASLRAQKNNSDNKYHLSLGVGFDCDFGLGTSNYAIPIELRIGKPNNTFNIAFGERISFHNGGNDSAVYYDPAYGFGLYEPMVKFTQFSTFVGTRWNVWHSNQMSIFFGFIYYLNVNGMGRVMIDVPHTSYINGNIVYTSSKEDRHRFYYDEMMHRISHSARFELGFNLNIIELVGFVSCDITPNFKKDLLDYDIYYDPTASDRDISSYPVNGYSAINLRSIEGVDDAIMDRFFIGFAIKLYFGTGYLKSL